MHGDQIGCGKRRSNPKVIETLLKAVERRIRADGAGQRARFIQQAQHVRGGAVAVTHRHSTAKSTGSPNVLVLPRNMRVRKMSV